MDEAGEKIAQLLVHYFPTDKDITAYLGKGHNAGDALVALSHLKQQGWNINLQTSLSLCDFAPLTHKKLTTLGLEYYQNQSQPKANSIILDGLIGIGAKGALRGQVLELAEAIHYHRNTNGCSVVSIDIPSGVDADTGKIHKYAIIADLTLTVGYPKTGLLRSTAANHVGALRLIKLTALQTKNLTNNTHPLLICNHSLTRIRRPFVTHKGQAGRVGIWAGSEGMLGAAVLVASAALKAGAGLVTAFISPSLYPVLSSMMPAEVMVRPSLDPTDLMAQKFDSLVIGPGMGTPDTLQTKALFETVKQTMVPLVLDADMLNLMSKHEVLSDLHAHCILTPHPGEMLRMFPEAAQRAREEIVRDFLLKYSVTLLYKGARTIVSHPGAPLFVNSSGTPAMATAGQGDVLSGLIAGLCAQKYSPLEATKTAAWLAGEASQLAIANNVETEETLTATSTLAQLPQALSQITRRG